ncbi:hypothetical protein ACLKA6_019948 [Drosophila palustris]
MMTGVSWVMEAVWFEREKSVVAAVKNYRHLCPTRIRQPDLIGAEGERIPSELRAAINIALFQAQQTYMTAMDTQLAEYKTMIRQEMLAFMAQIRETVQNINSGNPEPSEQQRLSALLELSTALVAGNSVDSLVDKCHNEVLKKQQLWESMLAWTFPPLEAAQEDVSKSTTGRGAEAVYERLSRSKRIRMLGFTVSCIQASATEWSSVAMEHNNEGLLYADGW